MARLKGILDVFLEERPTPPPDVEAEGHSASDAAVAIPVPARSVTPGEVDPRFEEQLHKEVARGTPAAYTRFLEQLAALGPIISDEAQRYNAAFTAAKVAHSITMDDLLGAVNERHAALTAAGEQFAQVIAGKRKVEVDEQTAALEARMVERARLEEDLARVVGECGKLEEGIKAAVAANSQAEANFAAASAAVASELDAEHARIRQYLATTQPANAQTKGV